MRAVLLACAGLAAAPVGAQVQVVSPNSRTTTEGNDANLYPFSTATVSRYQQVYHAPSLASISGGQIIRVAFRLDGLHTAPYTGGHVYPNLTIKLSTTTRAVDQLSTTLNQNVGPDVRTVYNGPFTLPTMRTTASPHQFDLVVTFQTAFPYTGGNLLMEVAGLTPPTTNFFLDCENSAGDAVSRVYIDTGVAAADTRGLVTRFTATPAPCYANCDGSTAAPVLNVNDFVCFQGRFASGSLLANCDGSTATPVLNVNDFICFQQRFAAGCP